MKFKSVLKLIRPEQWVKNLFIFLPLFFSGQLLEWDKWLACLPTFIAFCCISSSLYCFNDIQDREEDRLHRRKRLRPIASGAISVRAGYILMISLFVLACGVLFPGGGHNGWHVLGILLFYYVLNILYSLKLKQFSIIDIFIVAGGFVFRLLAGGYAADILLSHWIVLMTFLLALFLALGKRRDDIRTYEQTGVTVRRNVRFYNIPFLNTVMSMLSTITVICHIMYTVSEEVTKRFDSDLVYISSVFVLAGFIRYQQIVLVNKGSSDPTYILLHDRFLQFCILGWLISFALIIYF